MELFSRDDCPALAGEPAVSSSQIMLWRDATGLILFDIAKVSSGAAFFDFLFQKKGLFLDPIPTLQTSSQGCSFKVWPASSQLCS